MIVEVVNMGSSPQNSDQRHVINRSNIKHINGKSQSIKSSQNLLISESGTDSVVNNLLTS